MENRKAWGILKPIKKNEEIIKISEKKLTFGRSEGIFLRILLKFRFYF
jgi:hypothetical protein